MKEIIDSTMMKRAITRMVYEIIEKNKDLNNVVLIGIKTRGVELARRFAEQLKQVESLSIPVGELDVRSFRDDLQETNNTSLIPEVKDKNVVLVDDVLFTGRTIRAAMDGIITYGRPARISLAVLVDRGHRELPIRADYVGKNIPSAKDEQILVKVEEVDGLDAVLIGKKL